MHSSIGGGETSNQQSTVNSQQPADNTQPSGSSALQSPGNELPAPPMRRSHPCHFPAIHSRLPLRTYADLVAFERSLDDEDEMELYLSCVRGGTKKRQRLSQMCAAVWADELLVQMTWRGVRDADQTQWLKHAIAGTRLPQLISNVLQRECPHVQYGECERLIKYYCADASVHRRYAFYYEFVHSYQIQ